MEGGREMSLSFNITLQTEPTGQNEFDLEITENYEGDKWHVAVFIRLAEKNYEHWETVGLDTITELFNYIRQIQKIED